MRICFTIGGRTVCFYVPLLIWPRPWPWPWPPPPPPEDPWKHVGDWVTDTGPQPNPWKVNVPIIATVATLAEHAQGELKDRLQQVVKAATADVRKQLPQGATLHLGAE